MSQQTADVKYVHGIVQGLLSGEHEEGGSNPDEALQEDIDIIAELIDDYDQHVLLAAMKYIQDNHMGVKLDNLNNFLQDSYRGEWVTKGEFARAEDEVYGEDKEGFRAFLTEYEEYIDWEEVANSPKYSDYTFIELPQRPDVYYVFQDI